VGPVHDDAPNLLDEEFNESSTPRGFGGVCIDFDGAPAASSGGGGGGPSVQAPRFPEQAPRQHSTGFMPDGTPASTSCEQYAEGSVPDQPMCSPGMPRTSSESSMPEEGEITPTGNSSLASPPGERLLIDGSESRSVRRSAAIDGLAAGMSLSKCSASKAPKIMPSRRAGMVDIDTPPTALVF